MSWQDLLTGDPLSWLVNPDDPGVRYLALRDLLDLPRDDPVFVKAAEKAHQEGPIQTILKEMDTEGYWVEPGPGYLPKYRSTVWSIILLAQLGASVYYDARISTACRYLLDHALTEFGQFSASGTPGSTMDCLQGNLCSALLDLDFQDSQMETAFDWMARSLTGDGVAPMGIKAHPSVIIPGSTALVLPAGLTTSSPVPGAAQR